MMLLTGLVIGLLLGVATGVAATALFPHLRRMGGGMRLKRRSHAGDGTGWKRRRRPGGGTWWKRRRAAESGLPRQSGGHDGPRRDLLTVPAPGGQEGETTVNRLREQPNDVASERTVVSPWRDGPADVASERTVVSPWRDGPAEVAAVPAATSAPAAPSPERTVPAEPRRKVVAFHSGAAAPVVISVPGRGVTVGASDEFADDMSASVHLQVAGDVVWASVQEPTSGLILRHGDVRTPLSPVPMPLRNDSVIVSGAWSFGLDPSSRAPRVDGTFTADRVPSADSLRVAVVLDCCALAPERSSAADMVALAYVPSTASPLEDAVNRARKHASYLPGPDREWDVLLITGPSASEATLGHHGLTTTILRSEVTRPRPRGAMDLQPALLHGDQVLVSATSEFPAQPMQKRTLTWRAYEQVTQHADDPRW
ncbi:hypothetical protein [Nocardioides zhouii]|uniref:Uncharacterized protein n=1 Tax=Nocardioides zhouii TaxID=1168729 RepID=A0A4Q2SNH6_9ACTN|nr:hypothetical protein [Nocardioides zhouii]RYC05730.1 hypothetical protein EUA94_17675 [Nocardioides zhouii]